MAHRTFTSAEKAEFMQAQGTVFAGHGVGLFSYYANAREAFEKCLSHLPLKEVYKTFGEAEFPPFEKGYNEFNEKLKAFQIEKAEAYAVLQKVLKATEINVCHAKHYTDLKGWQEANPEVTAEERAELVRRGLPPS